MNRESTRHDRLRDNLAATYGSLQRTCDYCETDVNFPPGKVEVEHQCVGLSGNRYRPDLSIWVDGGLIATLEVIDSHSPTSDVLAAEAELPAAFYWTVKGDFWCSSDCYRWSKEGRKRALAIPCCEYCERPFAATAFPEERFLTGSHPVAKSAPSAQSNILVNRNTSPLVKPWMAILFPLAERTSVA